uniref:AlNc14C13G1588 protein n=1 Tax=Albugo laibachii Nc14 TaxID=890382 RepID=F0W3M7_9STRA|nr:AlNc14C13G1588 [Albugo laibachii Nc14]CCA16266.1 AlNc14C20G2045 [Albugo laibachii Nc14]|eukprot:CCA16266.1 AlNc14C20G2045 [Albugo laibachii Nc14]
MESVRVLECVEAKIDSSLDDLIKNRKMQFSRKARQPKRSSKIARANNTSQVRGAKLSQSQRNPLKPAAFRPEKASHLKPKTSQSLKSKRVARVGRTPKRIALRKPGNKRSSKLSSLKSKKVTKGNGKRVVLQTRSANPTTKLSKRRKAIQKAQKL